MFFTHAIVTPSLSHVSYRGLLLHLLRNRICYVPKSNTSQWNCNSLWHRKQIVWSPKYEKDCFRENSTTAQTGVSQSRRYLNTEIELLFFYRDIVPARLMLMPLPSNTSLPYLFIFNISLLFKAPCHQASNAVNFFPKTGSFWSCWSDTALNLFLLEWGFIVEIQIFAIKIHQATNESR